MTESSTAAVPGRRYFTASTVLAGVLVAIAVTGVATLTAAGSGALQRAIELAGFGQSAVVEHDQHRRAATVAGLDAMVVTLSSELGDLTRQHQVSGAQQDELLARIAELDRELGALREQVAREGLFQQDTVLRGAVTDLSTLQASFEQSQIAQQKAFGNLQQGLNAQQAALAEVTRRLAQLDTTLAAREVTSSISAKPAKRRAKVARSKPRLASQPVLSGVPSSVVTTFD
jgi:maltooligosyltrehalose synthase